MSNENDGASRQKQRHFVDVDTETPIDADAHADAIGDEQIDADSDADLQRAIALSLAEYEANARTPSTAGSTKACELQGPDPNDRTPSLSVPLQAATSSASATPPASPPPQPNPASHSARGGPNLWLGALHAKRLARGGAPAPAPRGASRSPKAAGTFSGKRFYLNRLACAGAARCPHTVTFEDLRSGIFTTFCFDPEFLLSRVHRDTPVTIVKHWSPLEEKAGHFLMRENMTCLHPAGPLPEPAFVRVVVTSANLTQGDYEGVLQNFWAQDFPPKGARTAPAEARGPGAGFRQELYAFLEQLPLNPKFWDAYNLEAARVELVASVPGRYTRDEPPRYGCLRLASLLRKYGRRARRNKRRQRRSHCGAPCAASVAPRKFAGQFDPEVVGLVRGRAARRPRRGRRGRVPLARHRPGHRRCPERMRGHLLQPQGL